MNLTVWIASIPVMLCHIHFYYTLKIAGWIFTVFLELYLLEVARRTIAYGRVFENDNLSSMSVSLDGYRSELAFKRMYTN